MPTIIIQVFVVKLGGGGPSLWNVHFCWGMAAKLLGVAMGWWGGGGISRQCWEDHERVAFLMQILRAKRQTEELER